MKTFVEWAETVPSAQRKDLLVKRRVLIREKIRTPKSHHLGVLSFVEDKFVFYTEKVRSIREGDGGVNKNTVALSAEQYEEIIVTMKHGFTGCRPNERIATALMMEANLGLRISDILRLRFADIVQDGTRYRLAVVEKKTGKARTFTVPLALYQFIRCYCLDHGIPAHQRIFPITTRMVQKQLKIVCDYLGYQGIGTHSFRKFYATEIYKDSGYNIVLVQHLLQHSSAVITQRYIGIQPQEIEEAIESHLRLDMGG